jgi:hypothetical protein
MNQTSNEHFRTTDNLRKSFTHSCLGRLVIFGIILVVLLIVAHFNVPDKQYMTDEIEDDIRECILTHDSIKADWLDDAIGNIGYIFTHADSAFSQESWRAFQKYNKLEYHKRATYASMHLHNNLHPDGVRVGIGIFGVVIPTLSFEDLLLRVERMHGGYDKGVIQNINYDTDYMGEQPHIKEYHYKGDQTQ